MTLLEFCDKHAKGIGIIVVAIAWMVCAAVQGIWTGQPIIQFSC